MSIKAITETAFPLENGGLMTETALQAKQKWMQTLQGLGSCGALC